MPKYIKDFSPGYKVAQVGLINLKIDEASRMMPLGFSSYGFVFHPLPHDNGGLACILLHLRGELRKGSAKFFTNEGNELRTMIEIRDYVCKEALNVAYENRFNDWIEYLERIKTRDVIYGSFGDFRIDLTDS